MTKSPTYALSMTVGAAVLVAGAALAGCSGSSGNATSDVSPSATSPTPSVEATSASPQDAPPPLTSPMTPSQAARAQARLKDSPAVFRTVYSNKRHTLYVFLNEDVTVKQRNHVVQVIGRAANS